VREKLISIFDKSTEYCLYALIFFIPLSSTEVIPQHLDNLGGLLFFLIPDAAIDVFFLCSLFFFLIKKILKPDFTFLNFFSNFFLLAFVIFLMLSVLNSGPYLKESLGIFIFKWLKYILIFLLIQDTFCNSRRLRNVMILLLIMAGIVSIDTLSRRFLGLGFLRSNIISELKMYWIGKKLYATRGPFSSHVSFGTYLACLLSLAIGLLLSKTKSLFKLYLVILEVSLGVCLFLTFSRGAWLGLIASLFLMMILSRKFKPLILTLSVFFLVLFVLPQLRQRTLYTFKYGDKNPRFILWRGAWQVIKENPILGKGIGTFEKYSLRYLPKRFSAHAHNWVLQLWAEAGIFSVLSFILFVGSILFRAVTIFRKNADFLILGLISAVLVFLVHSLFDTQFLILRMMVLFWSLLGVLLVAINLKIKNNSYI
jgi:putative inorganic carbon (HCO3(-)) transporter